VLRRLRRLASLNRKITMNDSLWSAVDEEAGQRMIKTNGVDLCTQAFGDPVDPGMLLIMGATASMVRWPETLCRQLADSGLYVIRYDNRDTGASTSYAPYAPRQLTAPAHSVAGLTVSPTRDLTVSIPPPFLHPLVDADAHAEH
jgi:hypothetical protein